MDGRFFELDAKLETLRGREARLSAALVSEFSHRLEVSCIFHDCALEGVVLSYSEIKAAIDKHIISDASLIPSYQDIKLFKLALDWTREQVGGKRSEDVLEDVRKLYGILTPDETARGLPYRKENPLHRAYYHDIAPPDKIASRMRKLGEWLEEDGTRHLHPVERAAHLHFKLMSVFPWTHNTGRVARIVTNKMLMHDGYLPAVLHSVDRQRYYEALRFEHGGIVTLYVEAAITSVESALQFYDEAMATVQRRRAAS